MLCIRRSVLCSTLLLPVPTRLLPSLAPIIYKRCASLTAQIIRSSPSPTTLVKKPPVSSTSTSTSTSTAIESKPTTKKTKEKTEVADSETKPKRKKKQKEEAVPLELKEDTPEGYMVTAKAALKSTFNLDEFLPGQEDVLKILFNNTNAAAIFPTGSGKSLCFQLPGLVFPGLVVVVTPLISIMKDQVDYLKSIRVSAEALSGDMKSQKYQDCIKKLQDGKYRIILVSPERFSNKEFLSVISGQRISLIAIDEAHCISEWGLSFRPDYLRLSVLVKQLKAERTLVVTATASAKVVNDLKREFDIKPENVVKTGFYRKNLHLRAQLVNKNDKKDVLLKCILDPERPRGPTIVYVTYRKEAEDVADWLQNSPEMVGRGISPYHAGMERSVRSEVQNWFLTSPDGIVVSTIAFGMGVNKRNIRYVYHYNLPGSLEDYAQGIGRAGRDGEKAICDVMVDVASDVKELEKLIVRDTPSYKVIVSLLTEIFVSAESQQDRSFTVNTKNLFTKFYIKETKISTFLAQMEAHGFVTQQPSSYKEKLLTMTDKFTKEKIPEIASFIHEISLSAQLRELEGVQEMLTFLSFNGCQYKHMGKYFGDLFAQDCGHCNYCVTKKVLTVRQLPVLSSKSAFDRYKDSLSLIDSLPSSPDLPAPDDCHCNALGIKWTYNPQEFKGLTGWSFGVAKEYNGRLVYAHFPSLNNFRNLMQVSGGNETVYEALLGVTQRPFFAKLMIDSSKSVEDIKIAFADFLACVTSETLFINLNLLEYITMKKIGTIKTDMGEQDEYLFRAHVDNAVFENAEDFKKFYKLLHTRICWPRNAEEKKWKSKLFISSKENNNERLHPIYQLQACEPFYLGTPITKQMVKHPQKEFENELLGFYSNTKQWFNLDEVAPVGTAPLAKKIEHVVHIYNGDMSVLRSVADQRKLYEQLKKNINIKYSNTGTYMQFDVWIPDLQLCFEFQDIYHYTTAWYYHNTQKYIQNKDKEKELIANQQQLSLVVVPCWWDSKLESLISSILFQRPDLVSHVTSEQHYIQLNPPPHFFETNEIPDVGELMLASFQSLNKFHVGDSMWWIGEKYDGMRCCWNPEKYSLYQRYSRELGSVSDLFHLFPSIFIDGELWFGRGQFSSTFSLISNEFDSSLLSSLRLVSFDVPSSEHENLSFENRYNLLLNHISSENPINTVVPRMKCNNNEILRICLQNILGEGGEGLILQNSHTIYQRGRSPDLIKLKTVEEDKDAMVIGIYDDGVELKLPNGITFKVAQADVHVPHVKVGDVITFSFELSGRRDIPVNPKIYRIRGDLEWDNVVQNYLKDKHVSDESYDPAKDSGYWTQKRIREFMEIMNRNKNDDMDAFISPDNWHSSFQAFFQSQKGRTILGKFKRGYFQELLQRFPDMDKSTPEWGKIENRRKFFEEYAKNNNFDPLRSEHWYLQSKYKILSEKGAQAIILYHNNSLASAIVDLFPNIGLDQAKLNSHITHWHNEDKRKKLFLQYAEVNEFDPASPEQWYLQPRDKLLNFQGIRRAIFHHKQSLIQALLDLFPNIGLEKNRLQTNLSSWHTFVNLRRKFFENFAHDFKFDPLIPENWYLQNRKLILSFKGSQVIQYHGNSVSQALIELFPEVKFDKPKLRNAMSPWNSEPSRRKFFEKYAKDNGFDPLIPENWYFQSKEKLLAVKSINGILLYYGGNLTKALISLFPDIGLQMNRFRARSAVWHNEERQKAFLENYAKEKGFNPRDPEEWYLQSKRLLLSNWAARRIVHYHGNSVSQTLLDLFPDIGLDKTKLQVRKTLWESEEARRKFFEIYARTNGFNPLLPESWYLHSKEKIRLSKNARKVLGYHKNSVKRALLELFPDIGFDSTRL